MTLQKWLTAPRWKPAPRPERSALKRPSGVSAPADPALRAGERGAAGRRRVSVAGEPAGRLYPLVTELAGIGIFVTVTCRVLRITRQPYYRWLANLISASEVAEACRASALFGAHRTTPCSGAGFWLTRPATTARRCRIGPHRRSRPRKAGSARSESRSAARIASRGCPSTTGTFGPPSNPGRDNPRSLRVRNPLHH